MSMSSPTGGRYTKIGTELFEWEPWWRCSVGARFLWITIYACPDAKNGPPGLLRASVRALAELAHMRADEVMDAMTELQAAGLVEVDIERRIIRLTKLPDHHERFSNGRHLKGVWSRFQAFPDCAIRNAHIEVLHGLCPPNQDVATAWSETFASVPVPRRRRQRAKFDSDTSTPEQPGLFTVPSTACGQPVDNIGTSLAVPGVDIVAQTTDLVDQTRNQLHPIPYRIPPGTGSGTGSDLFSSSGESNDHADVRLAVEPIPPIPVDLPFAVADMLDALGKESGGRFAIGPFDTRLSDALCATIRACGEVGVGVDDLRATARWLAAGGLAFRTDLGPVWVAKPGNLLDAVAQAKSGVNTTPATRHGPATRRVEAAPASAFGSGRRRL